MALRDDPDVSIVYGQRVCDNPCPASRIEENPLVVFQEQDDSNRSFSFSDEDLTKGLLLVGETGCGKTNVMLQCADQVLQKIGDNDLCVFLDVKGDYAERFYDKDNGNHVMLCDPGHYLYADYCSAYNLFHEILDASMEAKNPEKMMESIAFEISHSIFSEIVGTAQPFFGIAAETLFSCVLVHCLYEYFNNEFLYSLDHQGLLEYLSRMDKNSYQKLVKRYPRLSMYLDDGLKSNQALGILGFMNAEVNRSFRGAFAMGKGNRPSFSMSLLLHRTDTTLKNKLVDSQPMILFIEYDLALADSVAVMYKIMLEMLLKSVLSQNQKSKGNVWLFMDEIRAVPAMPSLDRALNLGRSNHLHIIGACQSVSQLYTVYKEEEAASILEGFTNLIAFRSNDSKTRDAIMGRAGDNYQLIEVYSYSEGGKIIPREGKAIESWEISNLNRGEAFILTSDHGKFKFHFHEYKP